MHCVVNLTEDLYPSPYFLINANRFFLKANKGKEKEKVSFG